MNQKPDRRDFLKMVSAGMGALAFRPFFGETPESSKKSGRVARVTAANISVYSEPWDESQILYQKFRDDLLNVYYEVTSEHGPGYNPKWYRVWGGYVHSAYLQIVETRLNDVDYSVLSAEKPGLLGEITVPFSQSRINRTGKNWEDMYKLYYQSVFWVVGVIDGPDGRPWYRIKDDAFEAYDRLDLFIPAEHMRIIPFSELSPIHPELPFEAKRIEVSIAKQELTAFEYDEIVLQAKVSTGMPGRIIEGEIPTETPKGTFNIASKMPSRHMGDGQLNPDPEAYELPGTPWVCYFEPKTGVATHGSYWHDNYGMTMSHGCVNMPCEKAKWLYRWAQPFMDTLIKETRGYGTKVIVS